MTGRKSNSKAPRMASAATHKKSIGVMRARASTPRARPSAKTVTLWGSPLQRDYRALFLELEILAASHGFDVAHRHHGLSGSGDEGELLAAEHIEVATRFERRHQALRWFVTQGHSGLLPPAMLARELDIDAQDFAAAFFDGEGRAAVERDVRDAEHFGLVGPILVTVGASTTVGPPSAQLVLSTVLRGVGTKVRP